MITKLKEGEWMVEPDVEGAREYARLHVKAVKLGVAIDGQGVIPWNDLLSKRIQTLSKQLKANNGS